MKEHCFFVERLQVQIGEIILVTDEQDVLRALDWHDHETRMHRLLRRHYGNAIRLTARPGISTARRAVKTYFEGVITALDSLPVATGGTAFQREVWKQLRAITAGTTTS
jgi:methylated-DNA-[protein]-cysteine S-methyltransferase